MMIDGKYNEPVEVARRMLKDRDIQACVHCGAVVDYVPVYCCDGSRGCPCMGYPLYPPLCGKCNMYGENI